VPLQLVLLMAALRGVEGGQRADGGEERPGASRGRSSQAAHGRLLLGAVLVEQTGPAWG
jgi:hypothetical protein